MFLSGMPSYISVQCKFKLSTMILVMYQLFLMTQYYKFKTKLALYTRDSSSALWLFPIQHTICVISLLQPFFSVCKYRQSISLRKISTCRHFLVFVNTDKYRFNPHWHELWKQEKCSSLAPPRGIFYNNYSMSSRW